MSVSPSPEQMTVETSAFKTICGGQLTLSTQLIKPTRKTEPNQNQQKPNLRAEVLSLVRLYFAQIMKKCSYIFYVSLFNEK